MCKRTCVVNATAAREGGARTILRQLLGALAAYRAPQEEWVVFLPDPDRFAPIEGVRYVERDTRRWADRIRWDNQGLREWLSSEGIVPSLILSLQNTGVNVDDSVPQVVYFHQLLTLEPWSWNPFNSEERLYFLYKHVYPRFVRKYLPRIRQVAVQRDSVRRAFARRFAYPLERIGVFRPQIEPLEWDKVEPVQLEEGCFHLLYPATMQTYKNHEVLVRAVELLRRRGAADRLRIHLTLDAAQAPRLTERIARRGVGECFVMEGMMPYEQLCRFYKAVDALVFPSYIETFGLPLIEAASAGLPVLCSELPYTHEVLGEYEGARYIAWNDAQAWAHEIERAQREGNKFVPLQRPASDDWRLLVEMCRSTALDRA